MSPCDLQEKTIYCKKPILYIDSNSCEKNKHPYKNIRLSDNNAIYFSGELYLLETLKRTKKQNLHRRKRQFDTSEQESEVYVLTIRAYDLGVPRLYSTTIVKIYPPESKTRTMSFIVPGANPDRSKLQEVLSTLSGGKVNIIEIKPYKGFENGATNLNGQESSQEK